jgi:hypothetical protein
MSAPDATNQARKFKGVWIPAEVWLDRTLSITEKVMLVEVDSLQDELRGCYASNAHFAKFFDLSLSRVSEIISGLADKGLVKVEQLREGKRTIERRVWMITPFGKPNTPSENTMNPIRKTEGGYSENTQGSNTSLSNTGEGDQQPLPTPAASARANKIPYQLITDLYNTTCGHVLPKCMSLTDKRKKAIAGCWNLDINGQRPFRSLDFWEGYFADAAESAFLTGTTGKGWRADFDFLTRATAAVKILEGSYDR